MSTIMSVDPGLASGVVWGTFSETEAFDLKEWKTLDFDQFSDMLHEDVYSWLTPDILIVERFIPQSGANYTLKEDDVAALEVIGMLRHALVPNVNQTFWRMRNQKNSDIMDGILKYNGLWKEGKDVEWTDGRDVNDATSHALWQLADMSHYPTVRRFFR